MSRRNRAPTRRARGTRQPAESDDAFPAHRPPRDWRTVAPLAGDIRGRMERPRPTET